MAEIEENRKVNEKAIETIALYAERLTHIETNITEIKDDVTEIKRKIN
jgi:chromosome segregation ATPase